MMCPTHVRSTTTTGSQRGIWPSKSGIWYVVVTLLRWDELDCPVPLRVLRLDLERWWIRERMCETRFPIIPSAKTILPKSFNLIAKIEYNLCG